ncbi:MAG: hypothetical protein WB985_06080 [Candidatus Acidiferrales bacterium]
MRTPLFKSGPFTGVPRTDTFALAALKQTPVTVNLPPITWPAGFAPTASAFSGHPPGQPITTAIAESVDVLVILYTDLEISALLDVFSGDSSWAPSRKKTWNAYGHNFAAIKPKIQGIDENDALKAGYFGYLSLMMIGTKKVALYKTELHPKSNGLQLPFIPVIAQLATELSPKLVISTGTAGAVGSTLNCGDVIITNAARFHVRSTYLSYPQIDTLSSSHGQITNAAAVSGSYVQYAASNFTKLSLAGLQQCYARIGTRPGYSFLKKNTAPCSIYVKGANPVPGPEPMDIVSADYLTVDDNHDAEGLQALGVMNDTDDAFAFYALGSIAAAKRPKWLSVRNASEPQIVTAEFLAGTSPTVIIDKLKGIAGAIYGVYQYCTTLNSAFACWGVIAGM